MRQLLLVLCWVHLFFSSCAWAQDTLSTSTTASSVAIPPKQLPEPTSATVPDNTRYLNTPSLLIGCTSLVAAFKGKPCDIIFIGDSITVGWRHPGKDIWAKFYGNRNALNFGIAGDKTQNVLWRMDNMEIKNLKPKVAVILIGGNNHGNTAQEIADGVKAIITKTEAMFSGVKVILVSILPRSNIVNQKMMDADTILKGYADNQTVYYLDLVPLMTPVGNNFKGLGRDHLHPDASGYQIWADAMEPLLAKLLGESAISK